MQINSISMQYKNTIHRTNLDKTDINLNKENNISKKVNVNQINANSSPYPSGMIPVDKGTAAQTTVNVDRSTILSIMNYAANNPDTSGFEEMGMDDNKRWVVINGQRFETELTAREKELIKKAKERCGLISLLNTSSANKYKKLSEETVELEFNGDSVDVSNTTNNPKLQNLLNNDKVMSMFAVISKSSKIKLSFCDMASNG
ncbi:MAG: hypothetical protein ACRC28_03695 [Clostridium sp.]|uniref:hypothetical protein n=1 Tax=Clostridium sp. TaxID=1506 RepID=UPI003F2A4E0D